MPISVNCTLIFHNDHTHAYISSWVKYSVVILSPCSKLIMSLRICTLGGSGRLEQTFLIKQSGGICDSFGIAFLTFADNSNNPIGTPCIPSSCLVMYCDINGYVTSK